MTATDLERQRHHTAAVHARDVVTQLLIVVAMALVALMVLLALAYAMLSMVAQSAFGG